ncbi:MAG: hypothetical protein WD740_03095 [Anaerolineales bacterium]
MSASKSIRAEERPGKVTALAIATIVSGAINIMAACGFTISLVLGTFGIGLICAPLTILPSVLGIFEILYGVKLLANPVQPVRPSQAIAILEILMVLFLNVISLVVGILALILYNDEEVKDYFARINS